MTIHYVCTHKIGQLMCNYKYGHAIWFKKGRIAIGSLHKTARQFVGSLLVVGSLDNLPKTTNLAGFGNLPLSTIYLFLSLRQHGPRTKWRTNCFPK